MIVRIGLRIPFVLAFCVLLVSGDTQSRNYDRSVCSPPSAIVSDSRPKPSIPRQYSVKVEMTAADKQYTMTADEYYDYDGNRGAIFLHQTLEVQIIMDYTRNEVMYIMQDSCTVGNLTGDNNAMFYGIQKLIYKGNKDLHISLPSGSLHFEDPQEYIGEDNVRGIPVEHWKSCQYLENLKATMEVHWYFSKDNWFRSRGTDGLKVPVSCHVYGKSINSPQPFNHTYEFIDFNPRLPADANSQIFTPPAAIACKRPYNKPIPRLPDNFQLSNRYDADGISNIVTIWYSKELNLVRIDMYDLVQEHKAYTSTILDMNQEPTVYVINRDSGKCHIKDWSHSSESYPSFVTKIDHHIRTGQDFIFPYKNFTYVGQKTRNGIDCEVWAYSGKLLGSNETGEYIMYFRTQDNIPIAYEENIRSLQYKVHGSLHFLKRHPLLTNFDVSPCYADTCDTTYTRKFYLNLAECSENSVELSITNEVILKHEILKKLISLLPISTLQVKNIEILGTVSSSTSGKSVSVRIYMRALTTLSGVKSRPFSDENADMLKQAVKHGQFLITSQINDKPFCLKADPDIYDSGIPEPPLIIG